MMNHRLNRAVVFSLAAALLFAVGCPFTATLPQGSGNENVSADSSEPPAGSTECRVETTIEGMGRVDVTCSADGRLATLTAVPDSEAGFIFDHWVGSGSFSNMITVNNGATITAVFVSQNSLQSNGNGNANATVNGNTNRNDNAGANQNVNQNSNANANQNLNENGNDNSSNLLEVTIQGGTGSGMYQRGSLVTVTATVPQGKQFDRWIGDTEFIEVGNVLTAEIKVRVEGRVQLMALFRNAPTTARPPTIVLSIPSPQTGGSGHYTVFGRDSVTVTIDAHVFDGSADRVVVFADDNNVFNADDATQAYFSNGNTFSATTSLQLDVTGLQKDRLYYIGATISDGLNPTVVKYAATRFRRSSLPQMSWMGSITPPVGAPQQLLPGMILEGVNFEDNAGSSFAGGEDFTGDGVTDFIVVSRYGKPQFINPTGIGVGEAYLLEGRQNRRTGRFNLNTVGQPQLPGVVLTGIEPDFFDPDTEGLTDLVLMPDADGDDMREMVFGIPSVDSKRQGQLVRSGQFRNGGIVMVSSQNSSLGDTTSSLRLSLSDVGQGFLVEFVLPEPEVGGLCRDENGNAYTAGSGGWFIDLQMYEEGEIDNMGIASQCDGCLGSIFEPQTDDLPDTWVQPSFGFCPTLSEAFEYDRCPLFGLCPANAVEPVAMGSPNPPDPLGCPDFLTFGPFTIACACGSTCANSCQLEPPICGSLCTPTQMFNIGSGFYPRSALVGVPNAPLEPFGARLIGKSVNDRFGTSITISDNDLIVSSPARSGSNGETPALQAIPATNSGVAYIFPVADYWDPVSFAKPHQGVVDSPSCPGPDARTMVGEQNQRIQNIHGIKDFNLDSRNDIAVGAPNAPHTTPGMQGSPAVGDGVAYVTFRRAHSLEGDYVLRKLNLEPSDPLRLDGALFVGRTDSLFGSSLAGDVDFNGDGVVDLVIGAPNADNGVGEVYVVFGGLNVATPANGRRVEDLLAQGQAVRISGDPSSPGQFGLNIVNAGDVDGDGANDLLVAAPDASPRFDSNPFDLTDQFNTNGMDLDHTGGMPDNITGPLGVPDFSGGVPMVNQYDELRNAGLVYLILGSNRLTNLTGGTISITELGKTKLEGAIFVGRRGDRTLAAGQPCTMPGNICGDHLGGGDAGLNSMGGNGGTSGIANKFGKGRSHGLGAIGDIDNDGKDDFAIGSILADVRLDVTGGAVRNAGEAYIIYGFKP